jgi:hypothetical protein
MKVLVFELAFLGSGSISLTGKPLQTIRVGTRLTHIEISIGSPEITTRCEFGPLVVVGISTYGNSVEELDAGMSGQIKLKLEKGTRIALTGESPQVGATEVTGK